jgi:hypothetical protein
MRLGSSGKPFTEGWFRNVKLEALSTAYEVNLKSPDNLAASYELEFPADAGSANEVLTTTGASGVLTWTVPAAATALATARTIAMTGDVVWTSPSFDGSGDVTAVGTIQANAVDSGELTAGAVDFAHMSVNSIDSDQYVDGSIDVAHMSANSIDSDQYADGSIEFADMCATSIEPSTYWSLSIEFTDMCAKSTAPAVNSPLSTALA